MIEKLKKIINYRLVRLVLLNFVVKMTHATPIYGVNSVFEVFSPTSMVRFFEFSDQGWNISEGCIKDMYLYLDGLQKDQPWALKLFDASGYYSGGLFSGNDFRMGDIDYCRNLNKDIAVYYQAGSVVYFNNSYIPFFVRNINAKYKMNVEGSAFKENQIHQSICMPKSCDYNDLMQIFSYNNNLFVRYNKVVTHAALMDIKILKENYTFYEEMNFFVLLGMFGISAFIIFFASFIDCCCYSAGKFDDYNYDEDLRIVTKPLGRMDSGAMIKKSTLSDSNNNLNSIAEPTTTNHFDSLNSINSIRAAADSLSSRGRGVSSLQTIEMNSSTNSKKMQATLNHIIKANHETNSLTNVKMDPQADSMTINNINTNHHVNMVKVNKVSAGSRNLPSVISLDIMSGNCDNPSMNMRSYDDGFFKELMHELSWAKIIEEFLRGDVGERINSLNGLNVVCLLWVCLTQSFSAFHFISDNKLFTHEMTNNSMMNFFFANGSFAMDTFFFLSGISLAILFYSMTDNLKVDKFCGALEQILYFIVMIVNKVLTIILPYTVVLIMVQLTMKHFDDYSMIEIPTMDHLTCESNMWRNVLYIDTFFPLDERCMPWSWFISLEVQFFVVSCLLMLLSKNHPRYALTLCSSFFLSALITATVLQIDMKENEVPSNSSVNSTMVTQISEFNNVFDQPWIKISPYLIGMCLGYILHKKRSHIDIHWVVSFLFWIFSCTLIFGVMFGEQYILDTRAWIQASFTSSTHIMWVLILLWIIVSSVAGHGGPIGGLLNLKIFNPLSKLSKCVYLVFPLVTRVVILSSNTSIHLSIATIITMFLGLTVISFMCGLILYLLFEAPISAFLRVLHHRSIKS